MYVIVPRARQNEGRDTPVNERSDDGWMILDMVIKSTCMAFLHDVVVAK
jgi:hypothetical protein